MLPKTNLFGLNDLPQLAQLLQQHEQNTQQFRIRSVADVLLDDQGLLQGKYRLTEHALRQLCSRLSPHFGLAVFHLSGLHKHNSPDLDSRYSYSLEMCARWINDLIRLRFACLNRCHLILDHQLKTVEGLVGRKYEFVTNMSLLSQTELSLRRRGCRVSLQSASLFGRRLDLCWRDLDKYRELRSPAGRPDRFNVGYYFSNTESGGFALRASAAVIRRLNDSRAVSPCVEDGKLPHLSDGSFQRRFEQLLDKAIAKSKEDIELTRQLAAMCNKPLGIGGDEQSHTQAVGRLQRRLKYSCHSRLADSAILRSVWNGSYKESKVEPGRHCFEALRCRTVFDLFNSLTFESRRFPPDIREAGEQLAYEILLGNYKF